MLRYMMKLSILWSKFFIISRTSLSFLILISEQMSVQKIAIKLLSLIKNAPLDTIIPSENVVVNYFNSIAIIFK